METQIFSAKVGVCAGEPLGGHDPSRLSSSSSDELEVNGLSFTSRDGLSFMLGRYLIRWAASGRV